MARSVNGLGEMPLAKKTLPYPVMRAILKLIGKKRVLPLVEKAKKNEPIEETFIGHFALQMLRRNHIGIFSDSPLLPSDIGKKMGIARSFTEIGSMMTGRRPRPRIQRPSGCFLAAGPLMRHLNNRRRDRHNRP